MADENDHPPPPQEAAAETLDQLQARHRKELRDLQSRITQKKKNATKKTRKGVNEECAELERATKERHAEELRRANGEEETTPIDNDDDEDDNDQAQENNATTLQQQPTPTPPKPASEEPVPDKQDAPGQKPNRHRARLARRAAAAAALSEAAASEAAAQPDHRASERAAMERAFKEHALREKDIEPDGHCLFSAVADQLGAVDMAVAGGYRAVRRAAADYIVQHYDDEFAGFLEEPVEEYARKIRDTAEWGGALELSALARAYGVEIRVLQEGRMEVVRPLGDGVGDGGKTLWLAYYRHGYGLGEHYNSLRRGGG